MKKFFLFAATAVMAICTSAQVPTTFKPVREFDANAKAPRGMKIAKNIVMNSKSAMHAPARVADYDVTTINEQPEGTIQTYTRTGSAIAVSAFGAYITNQNGKMCEITTAPDGKTVYIKDPLSTAIADTWVKGTIDGNKIHVALPQCIYYNDADEYGLILTWSNSSLNEEGSISVTPDLEVSEYTYTINEDNTISLDGTEISEETGIGKSLLTTIWNDDQSWAGYSDWATVLTPCTDVANELPEGIVLEDYVFSSSEGLSRIKVGFDADKVYINDLAEAPIIGTIDGDKVTFESNQYLGILSGYSAYFVAASTEELYDDYYEENYTSYKGENSILLNFDAAAKTLTSSESSAFVINAGKFEAGDDINDTYISTYDSPKFAPYVEVEGAPATPYFEYAGDYTESYGQWYFNFAVPNATEDGNFIDPAKIEWCMMTDGEIYTFSPDDDYYISEDMEWLPYGFSDNAGGYDIGASGSSQFVFLYAGLFNEVSIQSRATFGENVYYSKICTIDLETLEWRIEDNNPTGIQTIETAKTVKNLFDLQGRRLNAAKGLVINNGKVTFVK